VKQLISLIRQGLYYSLCIAISVVTIVPLLKVPTTFPEVSEFTNSVELLVRRIYKYPPSFKWIRKPTEIPDYEIQSSTLLCPCLVSGCSDTDVFVFHVRRMKDFLNAMGAVLIKKRFTQKVGKVVTKQGYVDIGGITALSKMKSRKRIPLCSNHYDMLERGELRWADLRVTDRFTKAGIVMDKLELLIQPEKKRRRRSRRRNINQ